MAESTQFKIRCLPMGICSTDYWLLGPDQNWELRYRRSCWGGYLDHDDRRLEFRRVGLLLPRWELHNEERELITATPHGLMSRRMSIEGEYRTWELSPASVPSDVYRLEFNEEVCALFTRDHSFTRRGQIIVIKRDIEFAALAFVFALVARRWRVTTGSGFA